MILTHRIRSYFFIGSLWLMFGIAGMIFWYFRPESVSAETGATLWTLFGVATLVYGVYRSKRYETSPSLIKIDEKPFTDERWLVVQDKSMAFTGSAAAMIVFFCVYFSDNICYFIFGITDRLFVQTFQMMMTGIMGLICLSFFVSTIYYYYTKV